MRDDKKTVMVFGTFDSFHKGHENFLKQARDYGDYLIVVIARDETVVKIKGREPQNNEITRLGMIKQLGLVDRVILGSRSNKYKRIKEIKPAIICLGYDQRAFTENLDEKLKELNLQNTKIVRLKPHKPDVYKSSKLVN